MFSTFRKMPVSLGAAALGLSLVAVPQSGFSAVIHQVVFTENSSTNLLVTYDGSTSGVSVVFISSDRWVVTLPTTLASPSVAANWIEPDSTLENFAAFNGLRIFVESETTGFGEGVTVADGVSVSFGTAADHVAINAVFRDVGDSLSSSVPEPGSLALFGTAVAGFGLIRRRKRV